jgi:hypothetical protein
MKRYAVIGIVLLVSICAGGGLYPSWAQDAGSPGDGYYPVGLAVGEVFDACKSGQIVCPARSSICDDPKIAIPVDLPDGMGFKGVSPGTTLCSAASAVGPRRVFRITVH